MKNSLSYAGLAFVSMVALLPFSASANCLPEVTEVRVELPGEPNQEISEPYLAKFVIYGECLGSSNLRAVLAQGEMGMFTPLTTEYQDENTLEASLPAEEGLTPLVEQIEPLQLPPGEYLLKVQYNVSTRWGGAGG